MNLVILSRSTRLFSTRRLVLVGKARRHQVRVIDPLRCAIVVGSSGTRLLVGGQPIDGIDAVIPRLGRRVGPAGQAVLRQFELDGAYCLNGSDAVARARDKLRTLQLLGRAGVPVLATAFARHPADVPQALAQIGGAPCVIKFTEGSQGVGVMLAESMRGAASIIEAMHAVKRDLLLQRYVPATSDMRLLVVGRRVVAAMTRTAATGDFRANLHRGGSARSLHPELALQRIAVRAARALGLDLAGVDILATPEGPVVLEVNASPGLEGIEAASGRNVTLAVIKQIERVIAARTTLV